MRLPGPRGMILLGLIGVLAGFILPLLMVMGMLRSTFLLAFLSYIASLGGLILGIIGAAFYARERRR